MKRKTVILGKNKFGEDIVDYLYPLKKKRKRGKSRKVKIDTDKWGFGFAEFDAVNQSPFSVFCAENNEEQTSVVIMSLKDAKKICKALGIKINPPII